MESLNIFLAIGLIFSFIFPIVVPTWQGKKPTLIPVGTSSSKNADTFITNGFDSPEFSTRSFVSVQVYIDDPAYQHEFEAYEASETDGEAKCSPVTATIPGWFHACSGALIEDSHVLTAHHCMENVFENLMQGGLDSLRVAVGWRDLRIPGHTYKIAGYQPSESYNIAMIPLETPVNISKNVEILKLGRPKENCFVTGWGKTECGYPHIAQSVSLANIKNKDCEAMWRVYGDLAYGNKNQFPVSKKEVCYLHWTATGEQGLCTGDDGAILVCNGKAAGVAFFYDEQCSGCRPQVFSKINKDFIDTMLLFSQY